MIPLVNADLSIPEDAACQEASRMSRGSYIPCGNQAVAIIDNGDRRPYYMCGPCASHNVDNRHAKVVKIKPGNERFVIHSTEVRTFDICDAKNDRVVIIGPFGTIEIPYSWELAGAAGASFVLKPIKDTLPLYVELAKSCLRTNRDVVSLRVEGQP